MMWALALALVVVAGPASAAPVAAALTGFFVSAGASAATAAILTTVTAQLLTSVALTALSQALLRPSTPRAPGIATEVTTQGGVNPQSFVLGRYATAGNEVAPPMSHGRSSGTPNAYLTYVHDLGDMVFTSLNRLIVNDDYVNFGANPGETGYTPDPDYGEKMRGTGIVNNGWILFKDGTQTAADAMLLDKYGSYPDRPWDSDMIGLGVPYAICTFRYNRKVWNALPRVRYEVDGIKLYDPRKDTTVGGSGAHRFATPSTWEFTRNPAVMIYNILRGITLPDGRVWGGECDAADLPLANWFAAMNACDEAVTLSGGGTEPRYRAGMEVRVTEEPAGVIEELLKACSGEIVESGGVYRIRVGGVGLPVLSITDEDVIVTEAQSFLPFVPLGETYNAVHASYPEPASLYATTDAPPRYNSGYEAEDQGRQLVADLGLPAVPYGLQVQRLTDAWIREERRLRRHRLTLPPKAAKLEPLDAIAWTSAANGYTAKVFEVAATADSFLTLNQAALIRERDSGDYAWDSADEIAVTPPDFGIVAPAAQAVVGFSVTAVPIEDAAGASRRPGLRFGWTTTDIDDVDGVQFEVRVQATGEMVSQPQTFDFASGQMVTDSGLIGSTAYEARAQYVVSGRREVEWTSWAAVTTGAIFLTGPDLDDEAVTTPKVAQNAVTVTRAGSLNTHSTLSNNTWTTVLSLTFTPSADLDLVVWVSGLATATGDETGDGNPQTGSIQARLRWRGSVVARSTRTAAVQVGTGSSTEGYADNNIIAGSGTTSGTLDLQLRANNVGIGNNNKMDDIVLIVGEFKR
jgi:hypothetical protein